MVVVLLLVLVVVMVVVVYKTALPNRPGRVEGAVAERIRQGPRESSLGASHDKSSINFDLEISTQTLGL